MLGSVAVGSGGDEFYRVPFSIIAKVRSLFIYKDVYKPFVTSYYFFRVRVMCSISKYMLYFDHFLSRYHTNAAESITTSLTNLLLYVFFCYALQYTLLNSYVKIIYIISYKISYLSNIASEVSFNILSKYPLYTYVGQE